MGHADCKKKHFFLKFFPFSVFLLRGLKEIITPFPGPETTTSPTCDNFTKETKKRGRHFFYFSVRKSTDDTTDW